MKRPSLQFYPADWQNNANLRRCSFHDKGVWLQVMCLMHDSDEYGILRWPLEEIANATGCRVKDLHPLVSKGVLKGGDVRCEAYIHTPRHAGKDGEPVTLIPEQAGPVWYSSRMVLDEYNRSRRGGESRFTADKQPSGSPTARMGETPTGSPDLREGDGATTTSSSTSTREAKTTSADADPSWLPPEWREYEMHRKEKRSSFTPTARAACIAKLDRWRSDGHDVSAILRHSIDNGYTGLFEPKRSVSKRVTSNADAAAEAKRRIFGEKDVTHETN